MVYKLNLKQEAFYNEMEMAIVNKTFAIYNSNNYDRGFGKTTILNKIGFDYQSLGYEVYILTPINCVEYYVSKRISNIDDLRGIKTNNLIILIDEELSQSNLLIEAKKFCNYHGIPMIGFVRGK